MACATALSPARHWPYLGGMESLEHLDPYTARALLEWQIEMGVIDAVQATPVNRYALETKSPAAPKAQAAAKAAVVEAVPEVDPVTVAQQAAAGADSLPALQAALASYPHCALQKGARSLVFADGNPEARVMIIGEAPGRDEDREGRPFVGEAGRLLDKMFAAIGMARDHAETAHSLYITNVLPWRPPSNRDPQPEEIAMLLPFLTRHVALAKPDLIVLMGNHACRAGLGRTGITRLRGQWAEAFGRPVLPMFHPAYLLRNPAAKREAWADLLAVQERLEHGAD